jgi:hypothetical protein
MRQRASRNRNRSYGEMAELQLRYDLAFRERKWSFILTLLQGNWLEPIKDDNLFELYTLVLVLDVLAKECGLGEPERYGLIRRDREAVATFRKGAVTAEVYFDQSPVTFTNIKSEYNTIMKDYPDLRGSARRPDITIRFIFGGGTQQYLILEVKKSEDEKYGRDSVYKVLGYLRDFGELWTGAATRSPNAVLVFPQSIARRPNPDKRSRDLVFVSGNERARLAGILMHRIRTGNQPAEASNGAEAAGMEPTPQAKAWQHLSEYPSLLPYSPIASQIRLEEPSLQLEAQSNSHTLLPLSPYSLQSWRHQPLGRTEQPNPLARHASAICCAYSNEK